MSKNKNFLQDNEGKVVKRKILGTEQIFKDKAEQREKEL